MSALFALHIWLIQLSYHVIIEYVKNVLLILENKVVVPSIEFHLIQIPNFMSIQNISER